MTVEKLLEILSKKGNGQFIKVHWVSDLSKQQGAQSKKAGDVIEKDTIATVRKGIEYKNIAKVQEKLLRKGQYRIDPATGKKEAVPEKLPWGNWVKDYEGLLIESHGKIYVRFYTTPNKPQSKFILNGKEITKDELKELGVMQKSYWNNCEPTDCMTVQIKNIKEVF